MPLDIQAVESAHSRGKTKFAKWRAKYEEQFQRPVIAGQIGTLLASIPPEVREHLPERALKALEDKIMKIGGPNATQIPPELPSEPVRPAAQRYHGQVPGERQVHE